MGSTRTFFIKNTELLIHIVIWILYFSLANVDWLSNWFDKSTRLNTPAPILVILFPILFYGNAFWAIPKILKGRNWMHYLIKVGALAIAIELVRGTVTILGSPIPNFSFGGYEQELLGRDSIFVGAPSIFWFAILSSFIYRFTKDRIANTKLIEQLKTEKIQMELNVLKAHVNPHFLFNNLNALDDLIVRDKTKAKKYLHRLSNMYRYFITSLDSDFVSLTDEWHFIDDYIYLIDERYAKAYNFIKINDLSSINDYIIPPASVQSLIENVVKHNQGCIDKPMKVIIRLDNKGITVEHEKKLKTTNVKSLGTGLKNLKSRFYLLSNQHITIEDNTHFKVTLPLIKKLT